MIWPPIAHHVKNTGNKCLVIPAGNPKYPYHYLWQFNTLLNLVRPEILDALIVIPSVFENFMPSQEAEELIHKLGEMVPLISLNTRLEGIPSLIVDNRSGIAKAVRHLVDHHGAKNIAFMEGPPDNEESMVRKQAYLDEMAACGLTVKKDWILSAHFNENLSSEIISQKGNEWINHLDAIIAANDYMAFGIISQLQKMGYRVPEDIAVIGFDDVDKSSFTQPPLTTIHQPFSKIVIRAAELAVDLSYGKPVPELETFDTDLVIRASCGCTDFIYNSVLSNSFLLDPSKKMNRQISESLHKLFSPDLSIRMEECIDAMSDFCLNHSAQSELIPRFLAILGQAIDKEFLQFHSLPDWHGMFSLFSDMIAQVHPEKQSAWSQLQLFEKAQFFISRKLQKWEGYRKSRNAEKVMPLRSMQQNMAMIFNSQGIVDVLLDWCPPLDVKNLFISLFNKNTTIEGLYSEIPDKSMMILALKDGKLVEDISIKTPRVFNTLDLWPKSLEPDYTPRIGVVGPLYHRENLYGLIISEVTDYVGKVNEALRHQVSLSLHNSFLYQQREQAETRLQNILRQLESDNQRLMQQSMFDEMTGLLNRRGFMKRMEDLLAISAAENRKMALTFADMDGLKQINDNLGHAEGDRAIVDMAEILKDVCRSDDILARFGGDEFTFFSNNVPDDFEEILNKRIELYLNKFNQRRHRSYILSFSIGCFLFDSTQDEWDMAEIMKQADELLYERKREKRRRI